MDRLKLGEGVNMKKWILVTGASSGIGYAISKYLVDTGYNVVGVARDKEKLEELRTYSPEKIVVCPYDLTDLENIEKIFSKNKDTGSRFSGMVHCAGINQDMPIKVNDLDVMKNVMDINCNSFIEIGKYFSMKKYSEDCSSIVAISSIASLACAKGMCTYSVSKAGLNAAVKVMSKEFLRRKIRVNAILPSFVDTEMARKSMGYIGDITEQIQPLGIIEPEYIAYLVEYLLSDKAKYMTGTLIPVTAGA